MHVTDLRDNQLIGTILEVGKWEKLQDPHPNPKMQTSTKALVDEGLVVGFGNVALGSDGDASGAVLG